MLVRFRADATAGEADQLVSSLGLRRAGRLRGGSGVERLIAPGGQDVEAAISALRSSPLVEFAEPNFLIHADQLAPSDPLFSEQWALRNTGAGAGRAGSDIGATQAWLTTKGSAETVVAVLDTGVDFTHPDLSANRWSNPSERADGRDDDGDGFADDLHGWDFITNSAEVRDEGGHGTAVAGLIAARGDNGEGLTGVMWHASLMSLRVLDSNGAGDVASAVEAIDYAVSRGASVVNASWGTPADSRALRAAVERAWRRGVVVVCSAGNAGQDLARGPHYPASYDLPNIVAVAATDNADRPVSASNHGRSVLIAAPGAGLLTAKAGGGYAPVSGTSAAAAVVSGVAGLVKSVRPRLKAAKVREALLTGARPVGGLSGRVAAGGVVSAAAALDLAAALPADADLGEGEEEGPEERPGAPGSRAAVSAAPAGPPGVPGSPRRRMPDLDAARAHRPAAPRALAPVPSARRRCPPHDPRCNDRPAPRPTPTRTPTPTPAAQAEGGPTLLASFARQALLSVGTSFISGGRPLVPLPELDFYRGGGYAVSDAPTNSLLPPAPDSDFAGYAAAASPAPLVQAGGGLVAHWRLDEGSGAAASDSAGGSPGTLAGAAWSSGKVGPGSLAFDGVDDRVSLAASAGLSAVANSFTLAFWVNPLSPHEADPQTSSGYGGISGQRYAVWPDHGGRWGAGHAGAGVSVGTNGVSVYEHADGYMPATLVYQGTLSGWTHVAVVYENRQPRLYLNGTMVQTGQAGPYSFVHPGTSDLGGQVYGYFDGWLDDVRVYDRVLPAQELASLTSLARVNVAAASAGATASASSTTTQAELPGMSFPASGAINGDRKGLNWEQGGGWRDATQNAYPDWLEVSFAAAETINEVSVFSVQDNFPSPQEPTEAMTFSQYGLTAFHLEYWTGAAWTSIPGASVTGNNRVWRRFTFAPLTTRKIRVVVTGTQAGYSRVIEVEALRAPQPSRSFVTGKTLGAMRADAPGWAGMRIATGPQPLTVTSLGRLCAPGNSAARDLRVVRASDNATVATATVALAGCTAGEFRYAPLGSPVVLAADAEYLVVSHETGGELFHDWLGTVLTTTSAATVRHGVYTTNGGQTWGPAGGGGSSYVPLDFQYEQVPPAPRSGLTGYYFDNPDLTGHVLTRVDAAVDFSWELGAPAPGVGAEEFSVRWVGAVVPRHSETYTFHATTDDGVRLWVDGQLVVDRWVDQPPTETAAQVALEAGRAYTLKMEFYDRFWGATARLAWSSPSQAKEVIPRSQLAPCWKSADGFVRDFYQAALARQPDAGELQTWAGRLTSALDQRSLVAGAHELGVALFGSQEYATRARSDRDYVSDLYRGYLQRPPDQAGWDHWTAGVTAQGRVAVREAFASSFESQDKVRILCGVGASDPSTGGTGNDFGALLDPSNRTGGGGADPYSRNFNWSLPLVSLPGRAGLDLGLALSYNSLVWTKGGSAITFDADRGFPSPGFRLGFPSVRAKFLNPALQRPGQPERHSYLLLMPSGARVELRQAGGSNLYEAADSSRLRLREEGGGALALYAPDGTRLDLAFIAGEYRCVRVRDRNGNYLTAAYDDYGQVLTVTDTLGRVVSFNYDGFRNLSSITQFRRRADGAGTEQHMHASFGYTNLTLRPSFSGLEVVGTEAGATIPVVERVGLDDGSYYKFDYTAWGQVWRITHFAADSMGPGWTARDSHPLTVTEYNVAGWRGTAAAPQSDCPRFTERRDWAENWNGDEGVTAGQGLAAVADSEQAVTSYSDWVPGLASCEVVLPDRTTVLKETYGAGWLRGLATQSEVYALPSPGAALPPTPVKKTTTEWEQDDQTLPYAENPRAVETNVYDDAGNRRRTAVEYLTAAESPFRLPKAVREYKADGQTVWRRTEIGYRADSITTGGAYTNLGVIGLVEERRVYGLNPYTNAEELLSKLTYTYDEGGVYLSGTVNAAGSPVAPTRHDPAYGTGYVQGRGLPTGVRRWDAEAPTDQAKSVESKAGYNITGAVVFSTDPLGHKTTVDYLDRFSDGVVRNTFAYPTATADPDQWALASPKKAEATYDFDRGLVTKTKDLKDSEQTFTYDAADRLKEATTLFDGAKVRFEYPAEMTYVHTYFKVDTDKPEAHSWRVLDGAGRVIGAASDHPGSAGGYSAQETYYDALGRAFKQSNPTEVDGSWEPKGDDAPAAGGGWRYTEQALDWQGRPLRVSNPDGSFRDFLYKGCGCAGGQVTVSRDEAGRRRKAVSDILGRVTTVQDLTLQPVSQPLTDAPHPSEVYRTVTTAYNMRDQAVEAQTHAGASESDPAKIQKTVSTYDGHGRLRSSKAPVQARATAYEYYADDTLWKVHTPREAAGGAAQDVVATFTYNNRRMMRRIEYSVPAGLTGVPASAPVETDYDAAGNRLWMTDGLGRVDYNYDTLSRLRTETRQFVGLGAYQLSYDYNLARGLKSLTDPAGVRLDYAYDHAGRVTGVGGSAALYANVSTYASGLQYRAWGGLKQMSYGNGLRLSLSYNSRLLPDEFKLDNKLPRFASDTPLAMRSQFQYYADGRLRWADDGLDDRFDRAHSFDPLGRLAEAYTGGEARAFVSGASGGADDGPYRQTYQYDAWDNLRGRVGRFWSRASNYSQPLVEATSRHPAWGYDAAGNLTRDDDLSYRYDAAGLARETGAADSTPLSTQWHDGLGQVVRRETRQGGAAPALTYYVRSSVLGGAVVAELDSSGQKRKGYVFVGGEVLAEQEGGAVTWRHANPLTGGRGASARDGSFWVTAEVDPAGANVGTADPFEDPDPWAGHIPEPIVPLLRGGGCSIANPTCVRCTLDGASFDCARASQMVGSGAAAPCPQNDCGPRLVTAYTTYASGRVESRSGLTAPFQALADGRSGFGIGGMLVPDGFRVSFTGAAAGAAAEEFRLGVAEGGGGFGAAIFWSVLAGRMMSGRPIDAAATYFSPQSTSQGQNPYDNCYQFVNYLVGLASNLDLRSPRTREGKLHNESEGASLGKQLIKEAIDYKYVINNYGFEGFQDKLTAGWQDAGVYGHVLIQAGAYLIPGGFSTLGIGLHSYDTLQDSLPQAVKDMIWSHREQDQRPAEKAGNIAGVQVGRHLWNYITAATPREADRLRNSLKSELCKPDGYRGP